MSNVKDIMTSEKTQVISQKVVDGKMQPAIARGLINSMVYGSNSPVMVDAVLKQIQDNMEAIRAKEEEMDKTQTSVKNHMKETKKQGLRNVDVLKKKIESDNEIAADYDALFKARRKQFSALADFEIMPMIIPEAARVISFLVEECLSPDIQNDKNFVLDLRNSTSDTKTDLNSELEKTRLEYNFDKLLRDIYQKRIKLGPVFYKVTTFEDTVDKILKAKDLTMNETADDFISAFKAPATYSFDVLQESFGYKPNKVSMIKHGIDDTNISFEVEYGETSDILTLVESCHMENKLRRRCNSVLNESSEDASIKNLLNMVKQQSDVGTNRCYVESLDPSKVFPFRVSGRIIGYIYQKSTGSEMSSKNYMSYIKDVLKNSATKDLTETDIKNKIIKKFGDELLKEVEIDKKYLKDVDVDLFHDYLINSVGFGEKNRYVFYSKDEIFDFSRTDGSLLSNAIYKAKLAASLEQNNIMTKILRGRSKFIHTVNTGIGDDVGIYVENAIDVLTRPEARLGDLTGPFETIINAHQAASDIVIPTPTDNQRYITTDIIEGMNVDMDSDILKKLTNGIIMAMNANPAILDLTSTQIDFARTISMISKETANFVKIEQNEVFVEFPRMIGKILSATDSRLKEAFENHDIVIKAFKPSSIALATKNDEINAAKTYIDVILDAMPNIPEDAVYRKVIEYEMLKQLVNVDFSEFDRIIENAEELYIDVINHLKKVGLIVADAQKTNDGTADSTDTE